MNTAAPEPVLDWTSVCRYDELQPERGIAVLVGGAQIAVFRTFGGQLFAISNQDPFTGAYVLCRGTVGARGLHTTVTSPLQARVFDLTTGRCYDDEAVRVAVHAVRVCRGQVEVALRSAKPG